MTYKFFLILFLYVTVFGQVENNQKSMVSLNPFFYYNAITYYSEDSSMAKVDVYIQVPYNQLTFVKEGEFFSASYEATISLLDENDQVLKEKIWTEKIQLKNYDESVSNRSFHLANKSFYLKPGNHKMSINLENRESIRKGAANISFSIRDFKKYPFALSDLMIVSRIEDTKQGKKIVPNITRNVVFSKEGFFVFSEFYNFTKDTLFDFQCRITNGQGEIQFDSVFTVKGSSPKTSLIIKITKKSFPLGDYNISLSALSRNDTSNYSVSNRFFSKWIGVPVNINDLNKALDEMIYVTDRNTIEKMKDMQDVQEKMNAYIKFWKDKDPSPSTDENELMEEYYSRVEYTKKHFSGFLEGWKTDMGMVFIVLGAPDNVERYPFNYDAPAHEVWQYYRLNKSFVFVDYNGFGEYKLLSRDFTEFFRYR